MAGIVVIGGGVIGTSIAWSLASRGLGEVTLIERDRLGSGTTWHSAGNITWKPVPRYDQQTLLAYATIDRLEAETGLSTGWLKTGRLFLADSPEIEADYAEFAREAEARGIGGRWLTAAEAKALNPQLAADRVRSIWLNPLSGRVDPAGLTAAYAAGARKRGVRILEGCRVDRLTARSGRITGAETSHGTLTADLVVVAAGLWSRDLLAPLDIQLAQWPCEHFYIIAEMTPRLPRETPSFVAPDHLFYGREEVGGLLVGFFDENAKTIEPGSLPEPFTFTLLPEDWDKISPYFEGASRLFPALETAPIRRFINGPESFTPDGEPLIGRIAGLEGLMVASAMNSAGVTWSASTGELIADLVAGKTPRIDPAVYDPQRFGAASADTAWLKSTVSTIVSGSYRNQQR